jgi:hypothetical protein
MYFPTETRVSSLTKISRRRVLPYPGEVIVQVGQRVEPWDIVAQAASPGGFRIVEVAQALRVSEAGVAEYLLKQEGDDVSAGEPLAARGGLFRRVVRAPVGGFVAAVGAGRMLIEADTTLLEVRAGMRGRVASVRRGWGAVVETTGAVVQGIWGNGREGHGVLKALAESPDAILTRESMEVGSQGAVILAGGGVTFEALEFAGEIQVRGVVVGSLTSSLLPAVRAVSYPIIVTEGWGAMPMSRSVYDVLVANDGREVSLDGRVRSGWDPLRPEVIIPIVASEGSPVEPLPDQPLAEGDTVRVLRRPHAGATGTVVAMPDLPRRQPTEMVLHGAEVQLIGGERIFVPLANLERIY